MKINWNRIANISDNILRFSGFLFLMTLVHELVHMIDGYSENVAICFGFINWHRSAFVINGDNYTLYRGEPLAYFADIIVIAIIFVIYRNARKI